MKHSIILIAALLAFAACSRDHDGKLDSSFETELADIVTYTGVDQDNHATFRLDQRDDLPPITLFTTVAAPSKVQLNNRVLLYYAISHKAPDGTYWNVDASGLSRIYSDSLRINSNPLDSYQMRPIITRSVWRTGEYINLHGQLEYTGKSRLLYMMIDRDTKYNDTVDAYLVHDLMSTPSDSIFYWRDFYLSVNVGALKSPNAPCHVLRLNLNDAKTGKTQHNFKIK